MNAMTFTPLVPSDDDAKLKVALFIAGGSSTGKTFSALLFARGLANGGKIAFLDTENGRALHYRADFPEMVHFDFSAEINGDMVGFPPERMNAALDQFDADQYPVVVVDSWSHFWEGINGVLEAADQESDRLVAEAEARSQGRYPVDPSKFSQSKWIQPKARYRRLIERVIRAKCHVVICARAKPVIQKYDKRSKQQVNANPTKLRRDDIPFDIAADRDLVFEMTASMILTPERPGEPIMLKCPDQFRGIFTQGKRINSDMGAAMREWAETGGVDRTVKKLMDEAEDKAREGTDAFREWWKQLDNQAREPLRSKVHLYQSIAADADKRSQDDDPFADLPQADGTGATDEEREQLDKIHEELASQEAQDDDT